MKKIKFSELININLLRKMVENIYYVTGVLIAIVDADGEINIAVGWQDICTKFHRIHPDTCKRCSISDEYIKQHLNDGGYITYKCLNNMWDIALPIIIAEEHVATVFFGQFFYEEEEIDIAYFRAQALKFGFDEKQYLDALSKVPRYSKEKVKKIMKCYSSLVITLAENGLRELKCREHKKELEKNQTYLNAIFNSVNDAIFIHDVYGNIIDVNEATISMFGYSRDELINSNIDILEIKYSDYTKFNIENVLKKARNKKPFIDEYIVKDKNNRKVWVEVNINIATIDGEDKVVATVRNITARKQAELAEKNEALELERVRTEFFANISHELRTPLNIILCTIQVIEMYIKNNKKTFDINKIINNINIEKQNCYRLLRLINNLIDSTKLNLGYFDSKMINYNIIRVIEEITLSVAEYISNNKLNLIFDTDIKEKIVACDPDKIERIILNLLSNSIKFTKPGGSIFVNVFDGEEYITITLEDTGIGIPKEKINVIFDRFAQVDKSFARSNEGSGIGLSLVKSLVEMHGGTISVESKLGVGTKFSIKIPSKMLDSDNGENIIGIPNNTINNHLEMIKVEFSDIYK